MATHEVMIDMVLLLLLLLLLLLSLLLHLIIIIIIEGWPNHPILYLARLSLETAFYKAGMATHVLIIDSLPLLLLLLCLRLFLLLIIIILVLVLILTER